MKEKKYYIQYKIVLKLKKKRLLQRAFHFKSDIILEC